MEVDLSLFKASKTYIVAVSGGVDSISLLHFLALQQQPLRCQLIVAHFEHGIRDSSADAAKLVAQLAKKYNLEYEEGKGSLGQSASEAEARAARYGFLRQLKENHSAMAVVTAHHQDDVIETMMINLVRGTNLKGLSSLKSSSDLIRPLLQTDKKSVIGYAKTHGLLWSEDETNQNPRYLRNFIRQILQAKLSTDQRRLFMEINQKASRINLEIDNTIEELITSISAPSEAGLVLERYAILMLPKTSALAVINYILHDIFGQQSTKAVLVKTWLFIKTANDKSSLDVSKNLIIQTVGEGALFNGETRNKHHT